MISLVKLVGGVLLLAAPGTLLGGAFWWISRHQARAGDQASTRPDGTARDTGTERDSVEPGGPDQTEPGAVSRTSLRDLMLTGPRYPALLVAGGAVLVLLGGAEAVVANVIGGAQDFPGAGGSPPPDGLLRCCAFVSEGTALTTWSVVACFLLWTGLTAVAVGASWWDVERQAGRPDVPAWMDGLATDPAAPVAGVFPPTGAPPEPEQATNEPPAAAPPTEAAPRRPAATARLLILGGTVTGFVGVLLTMSLSVDRVGSVLYIYDVGPAVLGPVFLLPVGLGLVVSGGLWCLVARRNQGDPALVPGTDPA